VRARERDRTLALVIAAGATIFVAMSLVERRGVPWLDRAGFDVLASARDGVLVTLANSWLRSAVEYAIAAGAAISAAVLTARGRGREAAAFLAGLVAVVAATATAKAAFARPRPAHELVMAGGNSFPSSHAAYSIAILALAVVLTRTLPRAWRIALVALVALAVTLIGAWLIAVRSHYVTDVLAGWGLSSALFAACALADNHLPDR
jgi:membrane-associated phospholipid phosphatase